HGAPGAERPIVSGPDGVWRDLTPVAPDITGATFGAAFELDALPVVAEPQRFGPPIVPGKIICIGLNYRDHAAETGAAIPAEPILFLKTPDTVVGPDDEVLVPRGSTKTDYEVELGIVIGAQARYLDSPADAAACIGGYVLSHDVSEREFQIERGGQWDKGKNC